VDALRPSSGDRALDRRDIADHARVCGGRHRRLGTQSRRDRSFARDRRKPRAAPSALRRSSNSSASPASSITRFGISVEIRSPSWINAIAPPDAASGET